MKMEFQFQGIILTPWTLRKYLYRLLVKKCMTRYENTLNKIAPVFYKFASYSRYFFEKTGYALLGFVNYDFDTERYYLSNKVSYSLLIKYKTISHNAPYYMYYAIFLRKSNGFMVDLIHGFTAFITTMVINNFSFENQKIVASRKPLYLSLASKDLFIRLVGKDMYETLRRNIK